MWRRYDGTSMNRSGRGSVIRWFMDLGYGGCDRLMAHGVSGWLAIHRELALGNFSALLFRSPFPAFIPAESNRRTVQRWPILSSIQEQAPWSSDLSPAVVFALAL